MHSPAGEAALLQLCTGKLFWGDLGAHPQARILINFPIQGHGTIPTAAQYPRGGRGRTSRGSRTAAPRPSSGRRLRPGRGGHESLLSSIRFRVKICVQICWSRFFWKGKNPAADFSSQGPQRHVAAREKNRCTFIPFPTAPPPPCLRWFRNCFL